jgi:sulfide:quinone oxidoreductase
VLERFGGGRVFVGVTSTPFKCPPAPSETVLLVHDFLTERGLREQSEVALVMPLPVPIPPSPDASAALLAAFEERGIAWHGGRAVRALDPARKVAVLGDDTELPYDLFLGIPVHRAPAVVEESGLCADGWVPVDPWTLETAFPGVYAVGDVTSVGTPKAGVFSEGQAAVVADRIIAQHRGGPDATYDGRGICYIEYGNEEVARVEVTFRSGEPPSGVFGAPSHESAADKARFGSDRIRRWFGREWTNY